MDDFLKRRSEVTSTSQTLETNDEDDETRETLESQLQEIKTRLSRIEDSNSKDIL